MITLVTADPHFSANPRDAYRWRFLEETLLALVAEHEVKHLLVLGDITEAKDGHGAQLVNHLVDGVAKLAEHASVYILKGNHDYVSEEVPFYRFLRHLKNVRWINEPTALELRGLGRCLFLPHTRDIGTWTNHVDSKFDWYFCHQTFGGADLGQGYRATGGTAPFTRKAGDRVVSGDVHVPQQLGAVTYVGAPYTIDHGDNYSPRVLLLDDAKMRSVPVPGPQKRLAHVSMVSELKRLTDIYPGDIVKVRIEPLPKSTLSRAEVRAACRVWAEHMGVQLYAVEIITPKVGPTKVRDRHRVSDEELVRAYVKKMGQGKAAVAAGLKLMEETL